MLMFGFFLFFPLLVVYSVVSTSAIDCLEILISEMTHHVSGGLSLELLLSHLLTLRHLRHRETKMTGRNNASQYRYVMLISQCNIAPKAVI